MKWILRFVYIVAGILLVMFVVGFVYKKQWSKDVNELKVSQGNFSFEAKRDETGVWVLEAPNEESLFFGVGYIQGVDRQFQTEMTRMVAEGRLSELWGAQGLPFSRIMRFSSRIAEHEWKNRDPNRGMYKALEAFAEGRNHFSANLPVPQAIEFKLMGMDSKQFDAWTALDVLKIVRYHTWEFSYDYNDDLRSEHLNTILGNDLSALVRLKEDQGKHGLYEQAKIQGLKSNFLDLGKMLPPLNLKSDLALEDTQATQEKSSNSRYANLPWAKGLGSGLPLGASNMWIVADPKNQPTPTLCNDTHLNTRWPSSLYPIRYKIPGKIEGAGYMLPGVPFLVIGNLDRKEGHPLGPDKFIWGITMATFVNVQDIVSLNAKTLESARRFEEKYLVKEPFESQSKEVKLVEEWTEWGPRIDEIILKLEGQKTGALALDWMGFRKFESPLEFFYQRSLNGSFKLQEDLAKKWTYPSVNLAWMQQDSKLQTRMGHTMTGVVFRSKNTQRGIISEEEASKRTFSYPSERPYVSFDYKENIPFYLVSGNQKIYEDSLSEQLAFDWIQADRGERIVKELYRDASLIESEQNDAFIPALYNFVKALRKKFDVNRLCSGIENSDLCMQRVSELDAWDGKGTEDSVATTFAATIFMQSKWRMLPEAVAKSYASLPEPNKDVIRKWLNVGSSTRVFHKLNTNDEYRKKWESLTQKNWDSELIAAFKQSFEMIGVQADFLQWGRVHRVAWEHPIGRMGGDLGRLMTDSFIGMSPFISGGFDNPGRSDVRWDPEDPLLFPTHHSAAMRMCRSFLSSKGGVDKGFRWTNMSGPSGNPYSDWSRKFSDEYYFKERLFRVDGF